MTATDKLRARLNELGVEWWDIETNDKSQTLTVCIVDDVRYKYRKVGRGFIVSTCTEGSVTLEQAITATVGRGTCHMELLPDEPTTSIQPMRCTVCGHKTYAQLANYCPNCGAEVVV